MQLAICVAGIAFCERSGSCAPHQSPTDPFDLLSVNLPIGLLCGMGLLLYILEEAISPQPPQLPIKVAAKAVTTEAPKISSSSSGSSSSSKRTLTTAERDALPTSISKKDVKDESLPVSAFFGHIGDDLGQYSHQFAVCSRCP